MKVSVYRVTMKCSGAVLAEGIAKDITEKLGLKKETIQKYASAGCSKVYEVEVIGQVDYEPDRKPTKGAKERKARKDLSKFVLPAIEKKKKLVTVKGSSYRFCRWEYV